VFIDSHAHLDMKAFDRDREEVLDRAAEGNLSHVITVGIDLDSSRRALNLAESHGFVYAGVGYHPHHAQGCSEADLENLARMASKPKIVAWGEIGLDFFRQHSSRDEQLEVFTRQLEIASDLNLPVIIHDREAHKEVLAILNRMGKGDKKGVIHCFSGDMELAAAFMELGYYLSVPGTVTYGKAFQVRQVAAEIPLDRMLIETDAPFLTPEPMRGKRNEPLYVSFTAQEIARLRKTDLEEVAAKTSENARALFDLP